MNSSNKRGRLVYFRLSDEEFEALTRACERSHARSKSDLIRRALLELAAEAGKSESAVTNEIKTLTALARSIDANIAQLMASLDVKPATNNVYTAKGA